MTELSIAERACLDEFEARPAAPETWDTVRMSPDGRDVAIRRAPNDWRVSNGGHYRDVHVADWLPMTIATVIGPV